MDDLIAFVRARLDEDEVIAEAAQEVAPSDTELAQQAGPCVSGPTYAHIERHGPARVLREVERLRLIVASCIAASAHWDDEHTYRHAALGRAVLRQIAAFWDDHPDYRPEWEP